MKRLLTFAATILLAVSAFAFSYSGTTYKATRTIDGVRITISAVFTSESRGMMKFYGSGRGQKQSDSMPFSYEVGDGIINVYQDDGQTGYMLIDGTNTLIICDDDGNPALYLKRVTDTGKSSGKSGKSSGKKRRR